LTTQQREEKTGMKKRGLKSFVSILIVSMVLASCPSWNCIAEAANAEPALGQICLMAFGYAPQGWADCNGYILPISSNRELFSLLGDRFGGNGINIFALPNLQSPVAGARYCIATQGKFPSMDKFDIEAYCGQIELFPYTFSADDWVRCEGQTLLVSEYQT
jgi:microcystin-dependent protein